jgi:tetratricopeptide (TPR) repeat protein
LGSLLLELWAPGEAAAVLEQGFAAAEENGARHALARCVGQLAWARWLLGAPDEAQSLAARAERVLEQVTAPPDRAFVFGVHAYAAIARVHLASGAPERGDALLRPLLAAVERSGWREAIAITELVVGLCAEARGELERAHRLLVHAAEVADEGDIPSPAWEAHAALARIHRESGRPDEASEQLAMAEAIVERMTSALNDEALRDRMRQRTSA